jgi:hypothetical protein
VPHEYNQRGNVTGHESDKGYQKGEKQRQHYWFHQKIDQCRDTGTQRKDGDRELQFRQGAAPKFLIGIIDIDYSGNCINRYLLVKEQKHVRVSHYDYE